MSEALNILATNIIGCILGYIYGLSLIMQREKAQFAHIISFLRVVVTCAILIYLLHTCLLNFILLFVSFILAFWLVIIKRK